MEQNRTFCSSPCCLPRISLLRRGIYLLPAALRSFLPRNANGNIVTGKSIEEIAFVRNARCVRPVLMAENSSSRYIFLSNRCLCSCFSFSLNIPRAKPGTTVTFIRFQPEYLALCTSERKHTPVFTPGSIPLLYSSHLNWLSCQQLQHSRNGFPN